MMVDVHATRDSDSALYAEFAPELVRFATVLIGPSGADDLVADAVLKVFSQPGWSSVENRRGYLYRAVLNEARQTFRSRDRRRRREQRVAVSERLDSPEVRPEVVAAMRRLAPRQRAVVFFKYWQDRSAADIADELGLTTRTVQRDLASARSILMEALS